MGTKTDIGWTDSTWNPIRGCRRVSAGCQNCYAETMAARFCGPGQPYEGLVTLGKRWNGKVKKVPEKLADPLRWTKPRRVFVNSMSDLFLESLDFEYIAAVFGVMASSERHVFQVLTKRPARMLEFFDWLQTQVEATERYGYDHPWPERALDGSWNEDWRRHETLNHAARQVVRHRGLTSGYGSMTWPLPNVWLGVSVEDQATAEERIPLLLKAPTAVPWVSYEPALGPVDFWPWANGLSWIVVGGESGRDARTFDMKWARDVVDLGERSDVNVNVFVKQMGANVVDSDASGTTAPRMPTPVPQSFKHIKGADPEEWEEGLRVQDWPRA